MDLLHDDELPRHERELTLSTGAILGIFLGLVVLCGGFFGFGYNMGRKSAPTPLNLADINTESTLPATVNTPKPTPGSPLGADASASPAVLPTPKPVRKPTPPPVDAETADTTPDIPKPATRTPAATTPAPIVRPPAPVSPAALNPSATPAGGGGTFMVQVAAVSHQEDAELLVGALRGRGYAVSARPNTADNFIHVQVGPFHSKQEADAMRQRLLTDGYNAIVKQ